MQSCSWRGSRAEGVVLRKVTFENPIISFFPSLVVHGLSARKSVGFGREGLGNLPAQLDLFFHGRISLSWVVVERGRGKHLTYKATRAHPQTQKKNKN